MPSRDSEPQPLPVRPPHCPRCGSLMRLVRIVPHEHQPDLDDRLFQCACGEQLRDTPERLD